MFTAGLNFGFLMIGFKFLLGLILFWVCVFGMVWWFGNRVPQHPGIISLSEDLPAPKNFNIDALVKYQQKEMYEIKNL